MPWPGPAPAATGGPPSAWSRPAPATTCAVVWGWTRPTRWPPPGSSPRATSPRSTWPGSTTLRRRGAGHRLRRAGQPARQRVALAARPRPLRRGHARRAPGVLPAALPAADRRRGRASWPRCWSRSATPRSYGGGMRICPDASPTDGQLDVTIIHPVSRFKLLQLLPQMYSGRFARDPCVEQLRATDDSGGRRRRRRLRRRRAGGPGPVAGAGGPPGARDLRAGGLAGVGLGAAR